MNNLKRGVATLSALLVTALVTLTAPTAALADTGGGTGGGGGGGTTTSGFEWRSVAGEKGDVYDTFLEKSGQTQTFAESEIKNRVDGGDRCLQEIQRHLVGAFHSERQMGL